MSSNLTAPTIFHSVGYRLAEVQAVAQVALEAGNGPQIIFQHYRELVWPKDAKSWFSITPGDDGKILYIEVPKDGHQQEGEDPTAQQPPRAAVAMA